MRVAMAIGDAGGIGPELAARVLSSDEMDLGDIIVFGDKRLLERGAEEIGATLEVDIIAPEALGETLPPGTFLVDLANCDPAEVPRGEASEAGGRAALQNFRAALAASRCGAADVVFFTPFNKFAMRLARPSYVDEIGFIDETLGAERSGREFNVLEEVWNARVTSHIPLRDVAASLSEDRVLDAIRLTVKTMEGAGYSRPRLGVAALNPHAGDHGNFGTEDDDILAPAVKRAQEEQIAVTGSIPSDTVFVRAVKGEFDAVMTMYHDQGQIAMKLLGFDRGVTLLAGYGAPIVTPAHGSAYDIAGAGKADVGATRNAITLGRTLAAREAGNGGGGRSAAQDPSELAALVSKALDPDAVWP